MVQSMMNDYKRWKLVRVWFSILDWMRTPAFFVGFCGGVCGVLVDFDHIIQVLFNTGKRPFHVYSLIIAIVVMFCCGSYLTRLCIKSVLRKNEQR
jgi:hypothetical protein